MAGHTTLGAQLRQLRGGRSLRDLAGSTGLGFATIGKYERGQLTPSVEALARILDALGVDEPERERMLAMVRRHGPGELISGVPSTGRQLAQLIGYERAASRITDVSPLLIPGLLQTRDYARAVLGESDRVRLRVERAEILTRAERPVEYRALIDSGVLTRPIGPPDMMRDQLLHLLRMAKLPNVTIQVMPADIPGFRLEMDGPFIFIESPDQTPIVHVEHYRGGAFIWETEDVRSFMAAADEIARRAMTPARSAEVIKEIQESL